MVKNNLIIILSLLSILVPLSIKADSEVNIYQYIKKDELNMTPFRYRSYIAPQLRSIISDFDQLLRMVAPGAINVLEIKRNSHLVLRSWNQWQNECKELSQACISDLNSLSVSLRRLDQMAISLQGNSLSYFYELGFNEEEIIRLIRMFDQIGTLSYQSIHLLENLILFIDTPLEKRRRTSTQITGHLSRITSLLEVSSLNYVPREFRDLFNLVWRNFFRPIDHHILQENNPKYLMTYLETLNNSFNEFHMRVSKGQNQLSENQLRTANTIHRRWNTILRILVRDIGF